MSGPCRAWIVAASIGAVEALKDQGVCRWNHSLRSIQQHLKNNMSISFAQVKKISSQTSISNNLNRSKEDKIMRKVMDLSCFGPTTTRF